MDIAPQKRRTPFVFQTLFPPSFVIFLFPPFFLSFTPLLFHNLFRAMSQTTALAQIIRSKRGIPENAVSPQAYNYVHVAVVALALTHHDKEATQLQERLCEPWQCRPLSDIAVTFWPEDKPGTLDDALVIFTKCIEHIEKCVSMPDVKVIGMTSPLARKQYIVGHIESCTHHINTATQLMEYHMKWGQTLRLAGFNPEDADHPVSTIATQVELAQSAPAVCDVDAIKASLAHLSGALACYSDVTGTPRMKLSVEPDVSAPVLTPTKSPTTSGGGGGSKDTTPEASHQGTATDDEVDAATEPTVPAKPDMSSTVLTPTPSKTTTTDYAKSLHFVADSNGVVCKMFAKLLAAVDQSMRAGHGDVEAIYAARKALSDAVGCADKDKDKATLEPLGGTTVSAKIFDKVAMTVYNGTYESDPVNRSLMAAVCSLVNSLCIASKASWVNGQPIDLAYGRLNTRVNSLCTNDTATTDTAYIKALMHSTVTPLTSILRLDPTSAQWFVLRKTVHAFLDRTFYMHKSFTAAYARLVLDVATILV